MVDLRENYDIVLLTHSCVAGHRRIAAGESVRRRPHRRCATARRVGTSWATPWTESSRSTPVRRCGDQPGPGEEGPSAPTAMGTAMGTDINTSMPATDEAAVKKSKRRPRWTSLRRGRGVTRNRLRVDSDSSSSAGHANYRWPMSESCSRIRAAIARIGMEELHMSRGKNRPSEQDPRDHCGSTQRPGWRTTSSSRGCVSTAGRQRTLGGSSRAGSGSGPSCCTPPGRRRCSCSRAARWPSLDEMLLLGTDHWFRRPRRHDREPGLQSIRTQHPGRGGVGRPRACRLGTCSVAATAGARRRASIRQLHLARCSSWVPDRLATS